MLLVLLLGADLQWGRPGLLASRAHLSPPLGRPAEDTNLTLINDNLSLHLVSRLALLFVFVFAFVSIISRLDCHTDNFSTLSEWKNLPSIRASTTANTQLVWPSPVSLLLLLVLTQFSDDHYEAADDDDGHDKNGRDYLYSGDVLLVSLAGATCKQR